MTDKPRNWLAGSPPRVRSRLWVCQLLTKVVGITSACAEQTLVDDYPLEQIRDHLRVCGADRHADGYGGNKPGSPPRVRSRHLLRRPAYGRRGITSACAEQTLMRDSGRF